MLNLFKKKDTGISAGRQATAAGMTVAQAETTQRVDGYEYFPPESVNWDLLEESDQVSVCHWKGMATYYDVVVEDQRFPAAAWSYLNPSEAAQPIKGHVAFWRGVRIERA